MHIDAYLKNYISKEWCPVKFILSIYPYLPCVDVMLLASSDPAGDAGDSLYQSYQHPVQTC